jgi:glycosyltransferase involved in cell wall biosynthesis
VVPDDGSLRVAWLGHRSPRKGDGIITYSREMTAGLKRRGVDVVFVHHHTRLDGHDGERAAADGEVVLDPILAFERVVISRPGSTRRLIDVLRRRRVDVVHVSLSFSVLDFNLPRLCHRLGIPIVATFHAPYATRPAVWAGVSAALYRLYAQALAACDAVIIFGEAQREILARLGVPRDVIHVVPNGVDVRRYQPGPSLKKQALGAEQLFTYVGRIAPEKNVDVLLDAYLDADPPATARMVVVGGGTSRRRLQRQYGDSRIVFTGLVTDAAERIALLRAADAFFLPSSVEGLSLAMLEAMACGTATVATDVGNDGEALRGAGIVVDPRHLEKELRAAVRLLIEVPELCRPLGARARQRAVDRYSLSTNLDRLLAIYRTLIGSGAPALSRP